MDVTAEHDDAVLTASPNAVDAGVVELDRGVFARARHSSHLATIEDTPAAGQPDDRPPAVLDTPAQVP
jgi:hypothetical protein